MPSLNVGSRTLGQTSLDHLIHAVTFEHMYLRAGLYKKSLGLF